MNNRSHDKRFHVVAPARAYGMLIACSGLLLAVGLALPLVLASSATSSADRDRVDNGPVEVEGGSTGADPSSQGTSTADMLPDTAQGLTDDSIKLGVVLMDLSSVEPLGLGLPNFSVELQQAAFDSVFDAINADGGINGRTIEPVYTSRDTLASTGEQSDKAICIKLAKDEQVFAVIGFTYDAGVCAASQYQLPVVAQIPALEQVYEDTHNLLVTTDPTLERGARNWANVLVQAGLVEDHKVGMVTVADGGDIQLPAQAAAKELEALGHPLTVIGELDPIDSLPEIPVLIQDMKAAGVDSVMLASDFANALRFIGLAEAQNFFPQYLTSDLEALSRNGLLANAGKSLDGAIGFTVNAQPPPGELETPQNQACRENYNETTDGDDVPAGETSAVGVVCAVTDIFFRAATAAGEDLSPRSFVQAVEALGTIDDLPVVLGGSFGPGKTDYANQMQPVQWSSDCACYSPNGEPVDVN